MSLPKVTRPEYSTTIPSSGKKVKYQPFTVREEKMLVLAAESQDTDEIANAVVNCLGNCVVSPTDFDARELALFDIEYLFLKCRAKSVGEKLEVVITDPNDSTYSVKHSINIDKITVEKTEGHTDLIDLGDDIQIKMNYPGIEFFTEGINVNDISESVQIVSRCVSSIINGDEVYAKADLGQGELSEWLEGLSSSQFSKITNFFVTTPKLKHTIKLTNPTSKEEFEVVLEGLADFF